MNETIYTTWARKDNHWVNDMLTGWQKSNKQYLCFPWIQFKVHTLPEPPFWMYFYYAKGRTDIASLKGRIEYRVRVINWNPESKFAGNDVYLIRSDEDGTVWFLCDRYEEIRRLDGQSLYLADFNHAQGMNLISTMRNSIPQVTLQAQIKVLNYYP